MLDRLERFLNSDVMDKIHEIKLDDTEIGSLKAIILLNPDSRGLHYPEQVLAIREKLYASLEAYCKVSSSTFNPSFELLVDNFSRQKRPFRPNPTTTSGTSINRSWSGDRIRCWLCPDWKNPRPTFKTNVRWLKLPSIPTSRGIPPLQ